MNDLLTTLFGHGKALNALQMGCRAFVLFFIALAFIRFTGMRAFGQKSAFDTIIVIMLGAILSRVVTGESAVFPTIVAGAVICTVHRLLALLSYYSDAVGKIVKGDRAVLFRAGNQVRRNMRNCCVSYKDILEEVRLAMNDDDMNNVDEVYMERSGKISVIRKKNQDKS